MSNNDLDKLLTAIEDNHKQLVTKYDVLVKRTNSIISTLKELNSKLNFLSDKMSMFEIIEEEDIEDEPDFDPYQVEPEDYEEEDD